MSLIVETGQAGSNSESYCSIADANAYFSARNLTLWADSGFSDTEKEGCLRRCTDYMEQVYRMLWDGTRLTTTQALSWPRAWVRMPDSPGWYGHMRWSGLYTISYYATNIVPTEVRNACAELAWRAAFGELFADQSTPKTSTTVGPISVTYAPGARQTKRYAAVDALLAPLMKSGGSSMAQVTRA